MQPPSPKKDDRIFVDIPWSTFLRGASLLLIIFITIKLGPLIGLILLSLLLAVTLDHVIDRMEEHGVKRRMAYFAMLAVVLLSAALLFTVVTPTMFAQMQTVGEKLPEIRKDLLAAVPHGKISSEMDKLWSNPEKLIGSWSDLLIKLGSFLTEALLGFVVVITFAFYFLLDGRRTYDWVISFFNHGHQQKLRATGDEIRKIISAYVSGQLITSALAFLFTAFMLIALDVPAWLMLAFLAAILDMVPVVGFLLTMVAIALLSLTVSPMTALYASLATIFYQGVENYLIAPRVYGKTMRLSSLAVLIAFAVGGLLAGALGVILALPVAAAYPAVERIWLRRYLGEKVVEEHKEISRRPPDLELDH